jgi:alkane 1-monooxygenase
MLLLAWAPPLWRRVMDPRVLDYYGGDIRLAALKPRDSCRRTTLRFPTWQKSFRASMSR